MNRSFALLVCWVLCGSAQAEAGGATDGGAAGRTALWFIVLLGAFVVVLCLGWLVNREPSDERPSPPTAGNRPDLRHYPQEKTE